MDMAAFTFSTICLILLNCYTSVIQTEDVQQRIQSQLREMTLPLVQPNESRVEHQQAYAGKLFQYILPKDSGNSTQVKVLGSKTLGLPDWLQLHKGLGVLIGVPSPEDVDNHIKLQISDPSSTTDLKNLFIHITDEDPHENHVSKLKTLQDISDKISAVKCPPRSSVTRAAVTFDANINKLQPLAKSRMIQSLCSHLGMPEDFVRMLAADDKMPLVDASALVSGLGDVVQPAHPGVVLQWEVGCGNVQAFHMSVLQKVEETAASGNMSSAVGHGVVGWHVTNHRHPRVRRRARDRSRSRTSKDDEEDSSGFWDNTDIEVKDIRQEYEDEGSGFTTKRTSPTTITTTSTRRTTTPVTTTERTKRTKPTTTSSTRRTSTTTTTTTTSPTTTRTTTPRSTTTARMTPSHTTTTTTTTPSTTTTTITHTTTTAPPPVTNTTVAQKSTTTVPTTTTVSNMKPQLRNQIPKLVATAGNYFVFKIPPNTFIDAEDGDTQNLRLNMFTELGFDLTMDPNSWLVFDNKKHVMYGLPLPEDVKSSPYTYTIAATDSLIATEKFVFNILLKSAPTDVMPNHELIAIFDIDYNRFIADRQMQRDLLTKIARAYGDSDPSKMTLTRIEEGSVKVRWRNKTLPTDSCPKDDIMKLLAMLVDPLANNSLNEKFVAALQPFRVKDADFELSGRCKEDIKAASVAPGAVESPSKKSDDSVFVSTVIPAVIIAALLIIAAIVACCLYKRRKSSKADGLDSSIHRGAPVIFAEELDDANKPDMSRTPLMLDVEKPPQPAPPEYGSQPSSPPSNHRELSGDEDDLFQTPYNRPPPFRGGSSPYGSQYNPSTPVPPAYSRIQP